VSGKKAESREQKAVNYGVQEAGFRDYRKQTAESRKQERLEGCEFGAQILPSIRDLSSEAVPEP
jgi:hypothetical protein